MPTFEELKVLKHNLISTFDHYNRLAELGEEFSRPEQSPHWNFPAEFSNEQKGAAVFSIMMNEYFSSSRDVETYRIILHKLPEFLQREQSQGGVTWYAVSGHVLSVGEKYGLIDK